MLCCFTCMINSVTTEYPTYMKNKASSYLVVLYVASIRLIVLPYRPKSCFCQSVWCTHRRICSLSVIDNSPLKLSPIIVSFFDLRYSYGRKGWLLSGYILFHCSTLSFIWVSYDFCSLESIPLFMHTKLELRTLKEKKNGWTKSWTQRTPWCSKI